MSDNRPWFAAVLANLFSASTALLFLFAFPDVDPWAVPPLILFGGLVGWLLGLTPWGELSDRFDAWSAKVRGDAPDAVLQDYVFPVFVILLLGTFGLLFVGFLCLGVLWVIGLPPQYDEVLSALALPFGFLVGAFLAVAGLDDEDKTRRSKDTRYPLATPPGVTLVYASDGTPFFVRRDPFLPDGYVAFVADKKADRRKERRYLGHDGVTHHYAPGPRSHVFRGWKYHVLTAAVRRYPNLPEPEDW